jgi:hypothetical protein
VNKTVVPNGKPVRNRVVKGVRRVEFQPSTRIEDVELDPEVVPQLCANITMVAMRYKKKNAIHNTGHASHAIMSTIKLPRGVAKG